MAYGSLADLPVNIDERLDESFDVLQFVGYLCKHWLIILASACVALVLTACASAFLSKRYTATASVLIEPPAGNDPRAATAVSPVYLESLKTYEHFASSDSLFAQALQHLRLREAYSKIPIESLKKKVLHVTKPRDTKILEISATLEDPKKAQALAQYIAEQTVDLSKSLDRQSEQDITEQSRKLLNSATARLVSAQKARDSVLANEPTEALESEIKSTTQIKAGLERDLAESKTELAENETRLQVLSASAPGSHDQQWMSEQVAATRGRIASVQQQLQTLDQTLKSQTSMLESRRLKLEGLDAELKSARAQYELASSKTSDVLASTAFRGERLEIVDPGTVPERPSSPNIPLNIAIAFLASVTGAIFYLSLRFSYSRLVQLRRLRSAIET